MAQRPARGLTAQDREVLRALADGCPVAEIGARLGVSQATGRNRVRRALKKVGTVPEDASAKRGAGRTPKGGGAKGTVEAHDQMQRHLRAAAEAAELRGEALAVVAVEPALAADDGQPQGAVTESVARALAVDVRRTDLVGLSEPGTVLIVLPGTGLDGANAAAERVRGRTREFLSCHVVAVEWETGEPVASLLGRVRRALQRERVHTEVGRALWVRRSQRT